MILVCVGTEPPEQPREVHPGGDLDGLNGASHSPPVSGVDPRGGQDLLPRQDRESAVQGLLVAQRREKVVTTPVDDPLGCVYLGVHRIGGDHHPVEVERFEQNR